LFDVGKLEREKDDSTGGYADAIAAERPRSLDRTCEAITPEVAVASRLLGLRTELSTIPEKSTAFSQ
jgi:hypothetical protein